MTIQWDFVHSMSHSIAIVVHSHYLYNLYLLNASARIVCVCVCTKRRNRRGWTKMKNHKHVVLYDAKQTLFISNIPVFILMFLWLTHTDHVRHTKSKNCKDYQQQMKESMEFKLLFGHNVSLYKRPNSSHQKYNMHCVRTITHAPNQTKNIMEYFAFSIERGSQSQSMTMTHRSTLSYILQIHWMLYRWREMHSIWQNCNLTVK